MANMAGIGRIRRVLHSMRRVELAGPRPRTPVALPRAVCSRRSIPAAAARAKQCSARVVARAYLFNKLPHVLYVRSLALAVMQCCAA